VIGTRRVSFVIHSKSPSTRVYTKEVTLGGWGPEEPTR
jgi:hypothetical protein